MTGDPLDRITNGVQVALRDSRDSGGSTPEFVPTPPSVSCADVLVLVEIARAARALIDDREGARIGETRLALRDALARLVPPR